MRIRYAQIYYYKIDLAKRKVGKAAKATFPKGFFLNQLLFSSFMPSIFRLK